LRYEIQNISLSDQMVNTLEKQMEAERQKRAEITIAQAQKQATINESTADREEQINISEGERQKRINEAVGKAEEISLVANAMAEGVKNIANAITKPGGQKAVRMKILDQFIDEFGKIMKTSKVTVVPSQLANIKGFFEGVAKVTDTIPTTAESKPVANFDIDNSSE